MDYYAGIDVSLQSSRVCVLDGAGKVVREATVASEADALIGWFAKLKVEVSRVGLEAGPLSQWLCRRMREAGLTVELLETRHVKTALQTMTVKTDRKDARGIAELVRLGWYRPVHCKSVAAQETRALLTARKLVQSKLHDVEMSVRGILRNFGLKVGKVTVRDFPFRVRELVAGNPAVETIAVGLLNVREALLQQFTAFERQARTMARRHPQARLLMTAPSIGPIVSLTVAAAIDDPARFRSSKQVGPHFGMTPRRYQSGETDRSGRISKEGDTSVREALTQAAHVMLTRTIKGGALKSWAMRLAKRAGMKRAKAALARKLAVILHRMLADGKPFNFAAAAA
jgi:transposase